MFVTKIELFLIMLLVELFANLLNTNIVHSEIPPLAVLVLVFELQHPP